MAAPDSGQRDLLDGVAFGGGSVYQFFVLGAILVVGVVEFAAGGVGGRVIGGFILRSFSPGLPGLAPRGAYPNFTSCEIGGTTTTDKPPISTPYYVKRGIV